MKKTPYPRRGKPQHQHEKRKYYTLNQRIEATELRVVDQEALQLGVMTRDDALKLAAERELDLVLIASTAKPPVAKLIDFKKFLYQEQKKAKEAKKGVKKSVVKDIKLSLFIAQGDLVRLEEKTKEFLKEGNQIRLNLTLKGREMSKKQMALDLLNRFIVSVGDVNVSKEPRLEGRVARAVIARKK